MKSLFRPDWDKILLIFALIIAIGFFILNTKNNLGFTPDSVTYYEVAKNIVNGKGIVDFRGNPVYHWPPGYSAFLATTSALFSTNPLQAGNILTSILLFLTLILLYKIFKEFGIPASIAFTLCGLYSISPIASIYILYLSESLFILIILLGILFLLEWLKQKNMMLLGLAALAIGVSFWIRYAGLYFIAGITLYLFFQAKEWKFKFLHPLLFLFISLLTVLPWLLYLKNFRSDSRYLNPDTLQIRFESFVVFLKTVASWIVGNKWGAGLLITLGILILFINRKRLSFLVKPTLHLKIKVNTNILLPGILILTYLGLTFMSSFLVHNINPDGRILSPIYPLFLCIVGLLLKELYQNQKSRRTVWFLSSLLFLVYAITMIPIFINHYKNGSGFTAKKYSKSEVLAYLEKGKYSSKEFIVNDNFLLRIHGNKTNLRNLPFDGDSKEIEEVKKKLASKEAILIYLDHVNWRAYFIDRDVVLKEFAEFKIRRFSDGFIIE